MMKIKGGALESGQTMLVVLCLTLGVLVGEVIDIEKWFERFGEWLKIKTGNAKDKNFVNAFLTASLTVCLWQRRFSLFKIWYWQQLYRRLSFWERSIGGKKTWRQ
ncbi:MAG: DUF554 family protein [Lachnospiraceae bacterium]